MAQPSAYDRVSTRLGDGGGGPLVATPAAEVKSEPVAWLWPGRIPGVGVTLLAGNPGVGKSLLTVCLASKVSRGELGPEGPGKVLLAGAEDAQGAVVKPRLEAANANLERVFFVNAADELAGGLVLPQGIPDLEQLIFQKEARLVVIDPLNAFLDESVNSWRDQSVRRALAPLHQAAELYRCAVLCLVHLNKAMGADPLYRTGGSIGVPAAARSALLLARDPDDPGGERGRRRVLAQFKNNYGELAPSVTYEIEPTIAGAGEIRTVRLLDLGQSDHEARALLSTPDGQARVERDEAIEFLLAELAEGPRAAKEIKSAARDAGIAEITLKRAKAELRVESRKEGMRAGWSWRLPEEDQGDISAVIPFDSHARNGASTGQAGAEGDQVSRIARPAWLDSTDLSPTQRRALEEMQALVEAGQAEWDDG